MRSVFEMKPGQRRKVVRLRGRYDDEVNDRSWRARLRPPGRHPRRERRRPGKPR